MLTEEEPDVTREVDEIVREHGFTVLPKDATTFEFVYNNIVQLKMFLEESYVMKSSTLTTIVEYRCCLHQ